jgi:hypothetical protein
MKNTNKPFQVGLLALSQKLIRVNRRIAFPSDVILAIISTSCFNMQQLCLMIAEYNGASTYITWFAIKSNTGGVKWKDLMFFFSRILFAIAGEKSSSIISNVSFKLMSIIRISDSPGDANAPLPLLYSSKQWRGILKPWRPAGDEWGSYFKHRRLAYCNASLPVCFIDSVLTTYGTITMDPEPHPNTAVLGVSRIHI